MLRWIAAKCVAPKVKFSFNKEEDSYYDIEENRINLNSHLRENDFGFFRHIREAHGFTDIAAAVPEVWTLLHEVGHVHTWVEDEEEDIWRAALSIVDGSYDTFIQDAYYNLENEWLATEWAINYIKKHPVFVKILNWLVARSQH